MPTRYLLICGMFLLAMLLYVDRVCISAAEKSVAGELNLDKTEMGWVFASFSLGYALFQTPSGLLADRYGPRCVLSLVVCVWSLFTALTSLARNLWMMIVIRFLFGAGEAGAFPGMARALYSWLPMTERGLAQGINSSASRLGAAFAMPGVAALIECFGWKQTFVILGGAGFVWAAAWFAWSRDDPANHPGISKEELEYILRTRQQAVAAGNASVEEARPLRAGDVVRSVNMWLMMGQYFASNFTFFFCLTWMLPYLRDHYSLGSGKASWLSMAPLLAGMVGSWVGGGLVDAIYRRGWWQLSRRLPATLGFALSAGGMFASLHATDATSAVLFLSLAIFGADMTLSPSWALCIDIGRRHAGAVSGTMNMAGNLGSFVTALAFPYLREWTGSTSPFFLVGAGLNLLAIVAWQFAHPDRTLEDY